MSSREATVDRPGLVTQGPRGEISRRTFTVLVKQALGVLAFGGCAMPRRLQDAASARTGAPTPASENRRSSRYSGGINVCWFGAVGDGVADDGPAIQTALGFGSPEVMFPAGIYRTTAPLWVTSDVTLSCASRAAATIAYEGTEYAIKVNSEQMSPYNGAGARWRVRRFEARNLRLTAPKGGGFLFGSTVNPAILLQSVEVDRCAHYAMDFGASSYFVTMRKCGVSYTRGIRVREHCDLFTVEECGFGWNTDYDLDIACPTFHLNNSDFELNSADNGNLANIVLRTSDAESGYGSISNCRFGPEVDRKTLAPHDIYFSNTGTRARTLRGLRLVNNRHFAPHVGTVRKKSPMLLDSGIGGFELIGPVANPFYAIPYLVTTSNVTNVVGNSALAGNYVDELATVTPELAGLFQARVEGAIHYQRAIAAQPLNAYELVWIQSFDRRYIGTGLPRVAQCIGSPDYVRFGWGLTLRDSKSEERIQVALHGSIVQTTLDTSNAAMNAPVYMGSNGAISLTPHSIVRVVARVTSTERDGCIRVDLSEPARYAAQPSSGAWQAGDLAPRSSPTLDGPPGNQYVVRGWLRLTNGTGHVAGIDWIEVRTPAGT